MKMKNPIDFFAQLVYNKLITEILSRTGEHTMSEEFGSDYVTIVDDDGQEFELEVLDTMDYNGNTYMAFLPADMEEDDPDYGIVILRSVFDEKGDEVFESIDDEAELDDVYQHFMKILFDDEDEEVQE